MSVQTLDLPYSIVPFAGDVSSRWSRAVGAGLLAAVVFVHEASFRIADPEQFSFDWQVVLRLGICAACGLFGLLHLPDTARLLPRWPGVLGLALWIWALLSLLRAVNVNYSLAAIAALGCMTIFAPAVLVTLGGHRLSICVLAALLVYLVASWGAHFAWPQLGADMEDQGTEEVATRVGGLNSSNGLGRQAALALALSLAMAWDARAARRWAAPLALLALATLFATHSRTALLSAVAALAALWHAHLRRGAALWLAGAGAFAGAAVVLLLVNGVTLPVDEWATFFARTGESIEIYHLTGRVELWEFVVEKIGQSPLFGYGWGGARFITVDAHFPTHHAHNVLLNASLNAGVVAGVILAISLLALLVQAIRRPSAFPDILVALILVGGLADAMMLQPIPDSHTLLWLISLHWRSAGASMTTNWLAAPGGLA